MRLLPRWRFAPAVLPVVGRASGAVQSRDDLGGGIVGKLFSKCHGRSVARENKSAMPKIEVAKNRQCRHNEHMSKYKAILKCNGSENQFDTIEEINEWASRATITFGCDLDIEVVEVVEKRFSLKADWLTGEVKEVAA